MCDELIGNEHVIHYLLYKSYSKRLWADIEGHDECF